MQKDLVVAIFVPTTGEGTRPGRVGTGYPVTEDLILTSRHVVEPENRNDREKILVQWFHDKPASSKRPEWIPIQDSDVIWTGKGDLDAALIRCRRPEHLRQFAIGRLIERRPRNSERWESAGFARAEQHADVREPGQFGGTLRTMAEADACFEVLEKAQPIATDLWKGVSGMPVFVGSEILGVVRCVKPKYDNKRLEAVPTWRLLQDEGFKKALGWDEEGERRERARKLLYPLLEGSEQVTRDLATALELSCSEILECRKQVVELLLTKKLSLEQLFKLTLSVQMKRRDKKDRKGAKVVADLMLIILPAIHNPQAVSDVRRYKGNTKECLIALPTKLRTVTEIIMAGADRRAAQLRPMPTENYFPEGELSLPEPPECGRDPANKQFTRDWRADLLDAFGNDCKRFDRNFRDYLKQRFIQSDQWADAEEELCEAVAEELRYQAEKKNLTYYFIAEMRANPEARQEQEAVLARLKENFQSIAFLRLAGGENLAVERSRYRQLCNLLYTDPESDR